MARTSNDGTLREGTKVRASQDLPGVPAGTTGRVIVAYGLQWRRYRVWFDNGVDLGNLDGKFLEPLR